MKARVVAEACKGSDLKPGDLFSAVGPEHWGQFASSPGARKFVYIRTCGPMPADQADELVYRIRVVRDDYHHPGPLQNALWDAINEYAAACGGDTGSATVGDRRMEAVAAVERVVAALRGVAP